MLDRSNRKKQIQRELYRAKLYSKEYNESMDRGNESYARMQYDRLESAVEVLLNLLRDM